MNYMKNNEDFFKETVKAFRILQKNIPKLTEGEKATLEIMFDKKTLKGLKKSAEDVKHGRLISWEDIKKDFK